MNIVLIETSGNQHYIFATNKLRENVGASEVTYQIGTKYVLQAVEQETKKQIWFDDDNDGSKLRANLVDLTINPPIESNDTQIEVIVATSGKAILLVKEKTLAEKIVGEVTKNALIEMPGLTIHGAIETAADDLTDIHEAVSRVHQKLENLRYKIPSNQQRFLRLPHVEPCATSSLPASEIVTFRNARSEDTFAFSKVTTSKRRALAKDKNKLANDDEFNKGRIINLLETAFDVELPENLERLEEAFPNLKWLAVIHADGNGLGEIFLKFDEYLGIEQNADKTFKTIDDARKYIEAYRKFSIALDICTINAVGYALKKLQIEVTKTESQGEVPVIPLVLGGDDLTVLCDGQYAVKFTKDFLGQFERETENINKTQELKDLKKDERLNNIIEKLKIKVGSEMKDVNSFIANNAFGVERLGICAGVAIVKPHYPFHQAYELAEQLLKSAKQAKTKIKHKHKGKDVSLPCSAMDFHILYDSSGVELKQIREKLEVEAGQTYLYAKPYIITNLKETPNDKDWLTPRTWDNLETRVYAMKSHEKEDNEKRLLPNSMLHRIRETFFRGKAETDSEVNLFSHRYKDKGFGKLLCEKSVKAEDDKDKKLYSLFFEEPHGHTTHFLDALDVVEFWKGFDCKEDKETANDSADVNSEDGGEQ